MTRAAEMQARPGRAGPWLRAIALGAVVGGAVVAGARLGLWNLAADLAGVAAEALTRSIGPVWIPMLAVGTRVGWLGVGAARTRFGRGRVGQPVRPELGQLAPLFAALGLCGTVWGLTTAFDALRDGEFLARLPALLGGLGAAMTSTLVGLGLQIFTLLLAAFNPAWSSARVWRIDGERVGFGLDGREFGEGEAGLASLVSALDARQPEALRVVFEADLPASWRARTHEALWARIDSAISVRELVEPRGSRRHVRPRGAEEGAS